MNVNEGTYWAQFQALFCEDPFDSGLGHLRSQYGFGFFSYFIRSLFGTARVSHLLVLGVTPRLERTVINSTQKGPVAICMMHLLLLVFRLYYGTNIPLDFELGLDLHILAGCGYR
jgi:hypothetical protein